MSNRGRQNVASFLALDLRVDWRLAAGWFESQLLDHDPASNYGNWCAAAGLFGGRVNRFNILKQSRDYDLDGRCVPLALRRASRAHACIYQLGSFVFPLPMRS